MSEVKPAFGLDDLGISPNPSPVAQFDGKFSLYDYCGERVGRHFNATRGKLEEFIVYCNNYTECDICRKRRYGYIFGRILTAYHHAYIEDTDDLCIAFVNSQQAKDLTRFLGRANVFRIPQGQDKCIVFCRARGTIYEHQPVVFIEEGWADGDKPDNWHPDVQATKKHPGTIHYLKATVDRTHFMDKVYDGMDTVFYDSDMFFGGGEHTRASVDVFYPKENTLYTYFDVRPGVGREPMTITVNEIIEQIPSGQKSPHMSGNLGKVEKPKREKEKIEGPTWTVKHTQFLVAMPAEEEIEIIRQVYDEMGPPHTKSESAFQESVRLFGMCMRNKLKGSGRPFKETIKTTQQVIPENIRWYGAEI